MLNARSLLLRSLLLPVTSTRGGRFLAPGSYYIPFSERFDEEGNRRPPPHPETPKFRDELPPATGPKIADKHPFRFVCDAKKIYWWCACGQSREQPFCDGHHSRWVHKWPSRSQKPMFKPIKISFEKKTEVWFCTCKQTGSPPFCDGSHNCELVQSAFKLSKGGQRNLAGALIQWNASSYRTLFSFFKKKKHADNASGAKTDPQSEGTHAELIWAEVSKRFEKNELSKASQTKMGLKHSQLKQLKKATFLDTVELFKIRSGSSRRGFNEFILAALKEMRAYEVEDDLEAYKALLSVLPRNKRLKATSILHADVGGYIQQQDTVIRLLLQLNANHVIPDDDVGNTIVEVFGFRSYVMTHYRRMMYWVPKLRHANPWPVVERLPDDIEGEDAIRLAQLAAARICPDPNTEFATVVIESKETDTPNCIVSAQSPSQRALFSAYATTLAPSPPSSILYLDGPQFFWYRELQLAYYVLWGSLDKQRLKTQVEKCQEIEDRLKSVSDTTSWDFSIPGSEKEKPIPLQPILPPDSSLPPPPQTVVPAYAGDEEEGSLIALQPKKSSLMRRGSVMTAERRRALWAGFGPLHEITHLPENLTRHEQAEGTIMGVGVVAPMSNALESQARAYGGLTHKEMPDPTLSLPVPAPPALIQQWLNRLRELNPVLDKWTVIIRNRIHVNTEEDRK